MEKSGERKAAWPTVQQAPPTSSSTERIVLPGQSNAVVRCRLTRADGVLWGQFPVLLLKHLSGEEVAEQLLTSTHGYPTTDAHDSSINVRIVSG